MIKAKYDWKLDETVLSEDFLKISKKHKLDELTSRVLYQRGIHDESEIEKFLKPNLEDLHDPFLLHDMEKATQRILSAIEQGENILIYGDYDADGMTAASEPNSSAFLVSVFASCINDISSGGTPFSTSLFFMSS